MIENYDQTIERMYHPENFAKTVEGEDDEPISSCCSARVYSPSGEWAICLDCKEHCDMITGEEEDEFIMEKEDDTN